MPLRIAKASDAELVLNILTSSRSAYLPYAPSAHTVSEQRNWITTQLIPTGQVVIAEHNNLAVGVMATSISDGIAWIDQLYISPGNINQGFGTKLLTHALDSLPRPIHLWTFQQNHRARRFYERHGFRAIKQTNGDDNEERCPDVLYELADVAEIQDT